jgi:hypothetical protein
MRCEGAAQGNIFELGYINANVGDAGPWVVSGLDNQATKVNFVYNRSLPEFTTSFSFNNLAHYFTRYDSTDQSVKGGLILNQSSNSTDFYNLNGYTLSGSTVSFSGSRGLSCKIKLNGLNKEFSVSRNVGANEGRILVQCFDSGDTLLTNSGGDLVVNLSNASLAYTTVFGGGWRYSSDNSADQVFVVDPSVAYVKIIFVGAQDISSFTINVRQTGSAPELVNVFSEHVFENRVATQAPDTGAYTRGYKVYDDTPSSSGFVGWVATADIADASVDNTAFKTFGAISA